LRQQQLVNANVNAVNTEEDAAEIECFNFGAHDTAKFMQSLQPWEG